MGLAAGSLRHRLDLEQRVETQDLKTGDMVYTWEAVATSLACSIEPMSAREFLQAQAIESAASVRVVIRWRNDVVAKMRLRDPLDGTIYNVLGVLADKDSNREYLTLPCSVGSADHG